jgi:hypothetical protein
MGFDVLVSHKSNLQESSSLTRCATFAQMIAQETYLTKKLRPTPDKPMKVL